MQWYTYLPIPNLRKIRSWCCSIWTNLTQKIQQCCSRKYWSFLKPNYVYVLDHEWILKIDNLVHFCTFLNTIYCHVRILFNEKKKIGTLKFGRKNILHILLTPSWIIMLQYVYVGAGGFGFGKYIRCLRLYMCMSFL